MTESERKRYNGHDGGGIMSRVRETVNGLLVEVFNHILFIEEQYMKHQGVTLSMTEVHILENVEKSETKTLGDVARLQMVTPGTLSVAVNSLVRKGYIIKCKDLQDKRVVRLLLSGKANEVLRIHHQFHEEMVDSCIADLDLEKEEVMIESLEKILNYFRSELEKNEKPKRRTSGKAKSKTQDSV